LGISFDLKSQYFHNRRATTCGYKLLNIPLPARQELLKQYKELSPALQAKDKGRD